MRCNGDEGVLVDVFCLQNQTIEYLEFTPRRLFMSSEGGNTLAFAMPFRPEVSCPFLPSMTTKTGLHRDYSANPPKDEEILARLVQRSDDTEEKGKVRLEQFYSNVVAVKGSCADIAIEVDGTKMPEDVSVMITKSLDALMRVVAN
jgi:hypothetical protein